MKPVERAVSIYKMNSQMDRGANSNSSLNYFAGGKSLPAQVSSSKNSALSFDKVLQSQLKKSSLR